MKKRMWLAVLAGMLLFGLGVQRATSSQAREPHPRIVAAMRALENAKKELQAAERDFGGHRTKAVEHVDQALRECREALATDKK